MPIPPSVFYAFEPLNDVKYKDGTPLRGSNSQWKEEFRSGARYAPSHHHHIAGHADLYVSSASGKEKVADELGMRKGTVAFFEDLVRQQGETQPGTLKHLARVMSTQGASMMYRFKCADTSFRIARTGELERYVGCHMGTAMAIANIATRLMHWGVPTDYPIVPDNFYQFALHSQSLYSMRKLPETAYKELESLHGKHPMIPLEMDLRSTRIQEVCAAASSWIREMVAVGAYGADVKHKFPGTLTSNGLQEEPVAPQVLVNVVKMGDLYCQFRQLILQVREPIPGGLGQIEIANQLAVLEGEVRGVLGYQAIQGVPPISQLAKMREARGIDMTMLHQFFPPQTV